MDFKKENKSIKYILKNNSKKITLNTIYNTKTAGRSKSGMKIHKFCFNKSAEDGAII